jgi:hypothetical protein
LRPGRGKEREREREGEERGWSNGNSFFASLFLLFSRRTAEIKENEGEGVLNQGQDIALPGSCSVPMVPTMKSSELRPHATSMNLASPRS